METDRRVKALQADLDRAQAAVLEEEARAEGLQQDLATAKVEAANRVQEAKVIIRLGSGINSPT